MILKKWKWKWSKSSGEKMWEGYEIVVLFEKNPFVHCLDQTNAKAQLINFFSERKVSGEGT
jgi:hypothetical protein